MECERCGHIGMVFNGDFDVECPVCGAEYSLIDEDEEQYIISNIKEGGGIIADIVVEILDEDKIQEISTRLATVRKNSKISLQEMADFVGLGYEQYRRIESGKVLVKTEYLFSIAKKLKVSTDFLLYGDSSNVISDNELANLVNGLSPKELERAKNVLKAVFI